MFVLCFFQPDLMIASQMLSILIFLIEIVDRHPRGGALPRFLYPGVSLWDFKPHTQNKRLSTSCQKVVIIDHFWVVRVVTVTVPFLTTLRAKLGPKVVTMTTQKLSPKVVKETTIKVLWLSWRWVVKETTM